MSSRARRIITLIIEKGSPLAKGRLPVHRIERADSVQVKLDPVSFTALLASIGRLFTVAEAEQGMKTFEKGETKDDPADPIEDNHGRGSG